MPNEYDFDLQQDRVRQQFLLLNSWCGAPQVYDLEEKYCSYPTQPQGAARSQRSSSGLQPLWENILTCLPMHSFSLTTNLCGLYFSDDSLCDMLLLHHTF